MCTLAPAFNLPYEILENNKVEWQKGIPVHFAKKGVRIVIGGNREPVFCFYLLNIEFKPGPSRKLHLRPEEKALLLPDILNPPEIHHIVYLQPR